MTFAASPDPVRPEKAIAFFRAKTKLPKPAWLALTEAARHSAFTVAGVAQLDVLAHVHAKLTEAITNGTRLEDFKRSVADSLRASWAGSVANPSARIETIFRTNVQSAYAAGRVAEMESPEIMEARPYWQYDAVMDGDTSEICADLDGTIRPANDPWWRSHTPPLHHNCRSQVITMTKTEARKAGGVTKIAPTTSAAPGFGAPPKANVTETWEPNQGDYPPDLWAEYQAKQKAAAKPKAR